MRLFEKQEKHDGKRKEEHIDNLIKIDKFWDFGAPQTFKSGNF